MLQNHRLSKIRNQFSLYTSINQLIGQITISLTGCGNGVKLNGLQIMGGFRLLFCILSIAKPDKLVCLLSGMSACFCCQVTTIFRACH